MSDSMKPLNFIGTRYVIDIPTSEDEKILVDIHELEDDGVRRPHELHLTLQNSQRGKDYPWLTAIAKIVSYFFQQGGAYKFFFDEMEEIFDPRGSYYIPGSQGVQTPSVVAHIGKILKHHFKDYPEVGSE